jgi:AcrR family transcriptional regulator
MEHNDRYSRQDRPQDARSKQQDRGIVSKSSESRRNCGDQPTRRPATRRRGTRRAVDLPLSPGDLHPTAIKLLDAAWRVYEASGWDGLSFYAIGREAGVSPSLVWYHFGSKNELLVVLADWVFHSELDPGVLHHDADNTQSGDFWELFAEQSRAALRDLRAYRLYFDMLPHMLDDEDTRSRLAEAERRGFADLTSVFDHSGTDPGLAEASRLLVALTAAITDGLAVRLLIEPTAWNVDEILSLWKECVDGILQRYGHSGIQS